MTSRRGWQDDATKSLHMILHIVDVSVDVSRSSNAQCAVFLSTEQSETYLKIYVLICQGCRRFETSVFFFCKN